MIEVKLTSDVDAGLQKARALTKAFPKRAEGILRSAIARERETHRYQNRTGDAEASTQLLVIADNGSGDLHLRARMGVFYASYLQKNRWSKFESFVARAKRLIEAAAKKVNEARV